MKWLISMFMSFCAMWGLLSIFCNERGEAGTPDLVDDPPADDPPADDPPADDPPPGQQTVAWPEGLEENYRNEGMFKPFLNEEKGIDVTKLAKSYFHTKKDMGRDKITVPNENTSPEEWDNIHQKFFGVDPSIENYNLEVDKESNAHLDEEFVGGFKKLAHELRIPTEKAQKIAEFVNSQAQVSVDTFQAESKNSIEAGWKTLKEEWGGATDQRISSAKAFIAEKGSEEFKAFLTKSGLGKSAELFKFVGDLATDYYKEGKVPTGGGGGGGRLSPAEATTAINKILADKSHPYHNSKDLRYGDAVKEMKQLHVFKAAKAS